MPEPPARRARPVRRRDPEDKRQRILNAAARFLGEEGYAAMTAARVAAEAGVSEGLIFHHFGSKRGLLLALAESFGTGAFGAVFAALPEGETPRSSEDVLRPLFAFAAEHLPLVRALAALDRSDDRDLAAAAVRDRVVAGLTDLLVRQEDLGQVRPMDPRVVAHLLFSLVTTALSECFVRGDGSRQEVWLRELSRCVDAALEPAAEPERMRSSR
jgi:AcrR family transcriptional regulator